MLNGLLARRRGPAPSHTKAKLLKGGDVILLSGQQLFRFPGGSMRSLRTLPGQDGRWQLVGQSRDPRGDGLVDETLASFASEREAAAAHTAVSNLYFGGGWGTVGRWVLGIAIVWLILGMLARGVAGDGGAVAMDPAARSSLVAPGLDHGGGIAGFNPDEPSLDDLASGNYRPNIRVQTPQVEMPQLSCAPAQK